MSTWSLTTCRDGGGTTLAAIRRADGTLVVPDPLREYPGLFAVLQDWDTLEPSLRAVDPDALQPVTATEELSLQHPRKLLCVGANYADHVAEMGVAEVPPGWSPYFFTVPPTTTMVGDGDPVAIPADPAMKIDWEAELAVIIGRGGRDIDPRRALGHVGGYACFNDITARGLLRREVALAPPFAFDWAGSKGLDTFCPTGPVTPAWQVEDPARLGIRCLVNGIVKQDGRTADMITGIADLIAAASRTWTLEPGDVIATGTPSGVGHTRGERLADGDTVRVEITGLAPLSNTVVARDQDGRSS